MHRTALIRALAAAAVLALAPAARAEEPVDPAGTQELGARLGVEAGGRVTPGGAQLAGSYLYRLSDVDWFEGGIGFTYGGGGAECFRERDDTLVCDHGLVDGFGGELSAGVRRFFAGQERFSPYARAALGARLVVFNGDDVKGFAVPLIVGGGVRAQVADKVSVVGGADLRAGPGWYSRDLGVEPHISLVVHGGVEFRL